MGSPIMVQSMNEVGLTPARSEKLVVMPFPALLRGRSCGGSRGRSSARSNPMFSVRSMNSRNGSSPVEIFYGKDPGSPKVTCIGQVRIKKKKKKKKTKLDSSSCRCFNGTALFWSPFSSIDETRVSRPPQLRSWRRWLSCSSGWSHQKKNSEAEEEETNGGDVGIRLSPDRFGGEIEEQVQEEEHVVVLEEEVAKKGFVPTTPPKNALLLMRCRSAPHRASSLAVAVSDQTKTDPIGDISVDKTDGDDDEKNDIINPDNQVGRSCEGSSKIEDGEETSTPSSPPLILTRSKSAPARETAKLAVAETNSSHLPDVDNSNSSNIDKIGKGKGKKDSSSSTTLLFLLLSDDSCGSSRGTVFF